jgi:hypothetical protein
VIRWKASARVRSTLRGFGNQGPVQLKFVLRDEYCRMIATTLAKPLGNITKALNWGINQASTLVQKPSLGRL